jgi:cytochrome c biogenesis protein CcdA
MILQRWVPLMVWVMIGILFLVHIRAITLKNSRLVIGIIGALVVIAIGLHIMLRAESDRVKYMQITPRLMPPFLLAKSAVTPDNFFKKTLALKPKLDEERKKEPSSGVFSMDDSD